MGRKAALENNDGNDHGDSPSQQVRRRKLHGAAALARARRRDSRRRPARSDRRRAQAEVPRRLAPASHHPRPQPDARRGGAGALRRDLRPAREGHLRPHLQRQASQRDADLQYPRGRQADRRAARRRDAFPHRPVPPADPPQPTPAKATMLYAIETPSEGGDTLFANAYTAYETLPEHVKERLAGRRAFNAYDQDTTLRSANYDNARASAWHPAVRTHPGTGRTPLYVNRLMTREIEGLPREESDALLQLLFDHQEQMRFVYQHVWRVGDILMWDNRCTLHARTDFSAGERRLLRRVTILGEKPV